MNWSVFPFLAPFQVVMNLRTDPEGKTHRPLSTNLPSVLTSFIGRKRELEDVRRTLHSSRLVTLTGAAGCGKTRLALRTVIDRSDQYPDGVHWVELARLSDPQFILPTVARQLNVTESSERSLDLLGVVPSPLPKASVLEMILSGDRCSSYFPH
jgi:ABC-type phosphate transport system ATPase subunit